MAISSIRPRPRAGKRIGVALVSICAFLVLTKRGADARSLSEGAVLARCYAQLTGESLARDNPLRLRLKTEKASDICTSLLSDVQLDPGTGELTKKQDRTSRRILRQFNDFHRSWFAHGFMNATEFGDALAGTVDIQDTSEAAYYFTRALFTEGLHYNSALRTQAGLEAIRDSRFASASGSMSGVTRASRAFLGPLDVETVGGMNWNSNLVVLGLMQAPPYTTIEIPIIQVGELVGIRRRSLGEQKTPMLLTRSDTLVNEAGLDLPHDLRRNYGGGALGSQGFLLYNFGHDLSFVTNGTTKLPRRWIAEAFSTFLCRSGPLLRDEDTAALKKPFAPATPVFRTANSCLRCHGALDQSAMTARNLTPAATGGIFLTVRESATVANYTVSAVKPPVSQEFWPAADVPTFRSQAPTGKLYFRSITGALVDTEVADIAALGKALSETDDYYACAAARYIEHFTGVTVPQQDPIDLEKQAIAPTAKDREWRALVLTLARDLKASGSLKTMIAHIFESNAYKQSDFGRFGFQ
jgi:hypothetical protein